MRHFSDFLGLVIERFIWSHYPYQSHVMIPGHHHFLISQIAQGKALILYV